MYLVWKQRRQQEGSAPSLPEVPFPLAFFCLKRFGGSGSEWNLRFVWKAVGVMAPLNPRKSQFFSQKIPKKQYFLDPPPHGCSSVHQTAPYLHFLGKLLCRINRSCTDDLWTTKSLVLWLCMESLESLHGFCEPERELQVSRGPSKSVFDPLEGKFSAGWWLGALASWPWPSTQEGPLNSKNQIVSNQLNYRCSSGQISIGEIGDEDFELSGNSDEAYSNKAGPTCSTCASHTASHILLSSS